MSGTISSGIPTMPIVDGLFAQVVDELFGFLLVFFDDFLVARRLDTLVFDEGFEGLLGDEAAEEVEARDEDGIRGVVDDERYAGSAFERDDVAAFFSMSLPFTSSDSSLTMVWVISAVTSPAYCWMDLMRISWESSRSRSLSSVRFLPMRPRISLS